MGSGAARRVHHRPGVDGPRPGPRDQDVPALLRLARRPGRHRAGDDPHRARAGRSVDQRPVLLLRRRPRRAGRRRQDAAQRRRRRRRNPGPLRGSATRAALAVGRDGRAVLPRADARAVRRGSAARPRRDADRAKQPAQALLRRRMDRPGRARSARRAMAATHPRRRLGALAARTTLDNQGDAA